MWEAIAKNRRKSRLLILVMGLLLAGMGGSLGFYLDPERGLPVGLLAAAVIWFFMLLAALYGGDSLLLSSAGATEITDKSQAPQLFNVVEEMAIASGLSKLPRIYIIDEPSPNAFAVGRNPETASIAVTSGLLKRLNRDELQGVIAHEIGHVVNLDIRFMTIAGVMVGAAALLSEVVLRGMRFGSLSGGRRRSSSDREGGGGQAQLIMLLVVIVFAILAPIAIRLLYFACSREREYLADASAARYTRYPPGLASALQKIAGEAASFKPRSETVAPMFIINPLQAHGGGLGLLSSHPPTDKRIEVLLAMGGGAGFLEYEKAFEQVTGSKALGGKTLAAATPLPAREGSLPAAEPRAQTISRLSEINDVIGLAAGMLFIACPCGVRIKLPGDFKGDTIACVHCGRRHAVPGASVPGASAAAAAPRVAKAGPSAAEVALKPAVASGAEQVYRRSGAAGWETFRCTCGAVQQLSPEFAAERTACRKCGRTIRIAPAPAHGD